MDATSIESIENWGKLNNRHKIVEVCGELIGIRPFSTKSIKTATAIIKQTSLDTLFGDDNKAKDSISVLDIISSSVDGAIDLILLCSYHSTGKFLISKEWLEELPADEFIKLAKEVYELNKSFFTEKILPMLKSVFPNITELISLNPTEGQESEQSTTGQTM